MRRRSRGPGRNRAPSSRRRSKCALDRHVGGSHYKNLPIQPLEYAILNRLGQAEMLVLKYITRHHRKDGAEALRKAIHVLEIQLELEYGQRSLSSD